MLDPAVLVAAAWALVALQKTQRQLRGSGFGKLHIPSPPKLPGRGRRGVVAVLRRRRATCLMTAAVLQAWDSAHGWRRDLVIGVTSPSEGFRAHAWLDSDPTGHDDGFEELLRLPPP